MPEKANSQRARACNYPTLHFACHATIPDFALTTVLFFDKSGPRGSLSHAAIEKFFNQVGIHLLRTDDLVLNSSLELNDVLGTSRVRIAKH
jgi:hypothetical protein